MLDKQTHVINHEISHLVMYLYMGGSIQDIREMQLKPLNGYIRQISHDIAESYFSNCCLALAGPVSDGLVGELHSEGDIKNAHERLRKGLSQNGLKGEALNERIDWEYKRSWNLTEKVMIENQKIIMRLVDEAALIMNKNKIISKNKIQKLAKSVIAEWNNRGYKFFKYPADVTPV